MKSCGAQTDILSLMRGNTSYAYGSCMAMVLRSVYMTVDITYIRIEDKNTNLEYGSGCFFSTCSVSIGHFRQQDDYARCL
jgi:hypothetical protein